MSSLHQRIANRRTRRLLERRRSAIARGVGHPKDQDWLFDAPRPDTESIVIVGGSPWVESRPESWWQELDEYADLTGSVIATNHRAHRLPHAAAFSADSAAQVTWERRGIGDPPNAVKLYACHVPPDHPECAVCWPGWTHVRMQRQGSPWGLSLFDGVVSGGNTGQAALNLADIVLQRTGTIYAVGFAYCESDDERYNRALTRWRATLEGYRTSIGARVVLVGPSSLSDAWDRTAHVQPWLSAAAL